MSTARWRPPGFSGGICGAINNHCSSVRSLEYEFLFIPHLSVFWELLKQALRPITRPSTRCLSPTENSSLKICSTLNRLNDSDRELCGGSRCGRAINDGQSESDAIIQECTRRGPDQRLPGTDNGIGGGGGQRASPRRPH